MADDKRNGSRTSDFVLVRDSANVNRDADSVFPAIPTEPVAMRTTITHVMASNGRSLTLPAQWKTGDIVEVAHVVPRLDMTTIEETDSVESIESRIAGSFLVKLRHVLVIGVFSSNLLTVPITTRSGRGNEGIKEERKITTVTIEAASEKPDSQPVEQRMFVIESKWQPRPKSYIQLTDMYTVNYRWPLHNPDGPGIRHLTGRLDADSISKLQRYVHELMNLGMTVPAKQHIGQWRDRIQPESGVRKPSVLQLPIPDEIPLQETDASLTERRTRQSEDDDINSSIILGLGEKAYLDSRGRLGSRSQPPSTTHDLRDGIRRAL